MEISGAERRSKREGAERHKVESSDSYYSYSDDGEKEKHMAANITYTQNLNNMYMLLICYLYNHA